jgi:hypothetical protein
MNARRKRIVRAMLGQPDETDAYYLALGKFIAQYAVVEGLLRVSLWHFASLKAPIAQAIMSGVRTEDAISYINRIADATKWTNEKKASFKTVFNQIQVINKLRNDIVHRGAALQADGTWLSTNKAVAHIPERITNTVVSAEALDFARNDLFSIRAALTLLTYDHLKIKGLDPWAKPALDGAWQYKPAPQGRKAQTNRTARRKQPSPPRSSPE